MSEVPNPEQEKAEALERVEGFVGEIWIHPLLTKETVEAREEFKQRVSAYMRPYEETYPGFRWAAIPVGSLVWVTSPESDIDFVLVTNNQKVNDFLIEHRKQRNVFHQTINDAGDVIESSPAKMDMVGSVVFPFTVMGMPEAAFEQAFNALITPDELCAGDVSLLDEMRFFYARKHKGVLNYASSPLNDLKKHFKRFILEWKDVWYIDDPVEIIRRDSKRNDRYKETLAKRSVLSSNPDYAGDFSTAADVMLYKMPSAKDFMWAMLFSQGQLHLQKPPRITTLAD